MKEIVYAMWLIECLGMTPRKCHTFFTYYNSYQKIFNQSAKDLNLLLESVYHERRFDPIIHETFEKKKDKIYSFDRYLNNLKEDHYVISPLNPSYPKRLLEIVDPPALLYIRSKKFQDQSSFFKEPGIALVGARRAGLYGRDVSKMLAKQLAKKGVHVISGLAYGIDKASHEGALEAGGFTTGVLGGGVDTCYPPQHQSIFDEIIEKGCVLSEEPFERKTQPYMFPKRNRIISGMSEGVVVVEAAQKSGSLITADCALEQGRDVFAVPGRILDPKAAGCNHLIKQGAKPVFSVDDIMVELSQFPHNISNKYDKIEKKLEEKEKIVYSCISYEPIHEEVLIKSVFQEISQCISVDGYTEDYTYEEMEILKQMTDADIKLCLLTLELKSVIVKKSGCYYARSEV